MVVRNKNIRLALQILLIFAISRGIIAAVYFVYAAITRDHSGFEAIFGRWDALYYTDMVQNGYDLPTTFNAQVNLVFFPLYPLLCKGLSVITFGTIPVFYVCIIVSNICIFIASFFAVKLIRENGLTGKEDDATFFHGIFADGLVLVWLIMAGPFTMYFATAYTESLFVLCIVMSFYFMKKKQFVAAGLFAALAGGTRSLGCLLIIPIFIEMWKEYTEKTGKRSGIVGYIIRRPAYLFSLVITPLGIFLFMIYLYFFCGDAWAFTHIQTAWRSGEHFPVIGVLWDACTGRLEPQYTVIGWICIGVIVFYVYMFINGFKSEATWGLATLIIPLTSHVMSTPRFVSGAFVVWIGIYYVITKAQPKKRDFLFKFMMTTGVITLVLWIAGSNAVI